jgi:broad specificity phosphatase PhoE
MQRAAEAARRLAEQTGMELVVEKLMREVLSGAGTAIDICEVIDS